MPQYDARGVTVVFGGYSNENTFTYLGDTWEWDGIAWTQQATSGPSPRVGAAMAYDAARGVAVMFGGQDSGGTYLGDTWEWNGTTWTQRATTGPAGRRGAAMAYDAVRGVT